MDRGPIHRIRLYDSKTGHILSAVRLEGATARSLRAGFEKKAEQFFARSGLTGGSPGGAGSASASPSPEQAVAPRADKGSLKVASQPSGAKVLLDGEEIGKTPVRKPLAAGSYFVTLELPGYAPATRQVAVELELVRGWQKGTPRRRAGRHSADSEGVQPRQDPRRPSGATTSGSAAASRRQLKS